MIGFLLFQATLGAIGRQALPPTGCAAFLWSRDAQPQLLAMVGADPGVLRVQLDGKALTLPRTAADGAAVRGLAASSTYAGEGIGATLALSAVERPELADGALVTDATLTVEQVGKDMMIVPLGGMIGCAPAKGN